MVLSLTFESPMRDMANIPIIGFFFCSTGNKLYHLKYHQYISIGPCMFVVYGVYLLVKRIQKCREFKQVDQDDSIVPTWSIKIKDIFSHELFANVLTLDITCVLQAVGSICGMVVSVLLVHINISPSKDLHSWIISRNILRYIYMFCGLL